MGVKAGVDLGVLRTSLLASPAASHFLAQDVLSVLVDGDYDDSFAMAWRARISGWPSDVGRDVGVSTELSALVEQIYRRARVTFGDLAGELSPCGSTRPQWVRTSAATRRRSPWPAGRSARPGRTARSTRRHPGPRRRQPEILARQRHRERVVGSRRRRARTARPARGSATPPDSRAATSAARQVHPGLHTHRQHLGRGHGVAEPQQVDHQLDHVPVPGRPTCTTRSGSPSVLNSGSAHSKSAYAPRRRSATSRLSAPGHAADRRVQPAAPAGVRAPPGSPAGPPPGWTWTCRSTPIRAPAPRPAPPSITSATTCGVAAS